MQSGQGTPTSPNNPTLPNVTPTAAQDAWTMNAVVQLSSSVSKLDANISFLIHQVEDLKASQIGTSTRVERLERKILVAAAIISIAIAAGGYFANKAIDFGLEMAKARLTEHSATVDPAPPSS